MIKVNPLFSNKDAYDVASCQNDNFKRFANSGKISLRSHLILSNYLILKQNRVQMMHS